MSTKTETTAPSKTVEITAEQHAAFLAMMEEKRRQEEIDQNGGFEPGHVHPVLNFPCAVDVTSDKYQKDPDTPYAPFRVDQMTIVLTEPREGEIKGTKCVFGPMLSVFQPGEHVWQAARFRRQNPNYVSIGTGESKSKHETGKYADSEVGIVWNMLRHTLLQQFRDGACLVLCGESITASDAADEKEATELVEAFCQEVETELREWFAELDKPQEKPQTRHDRGAKRSRLKTRR